MAKVYLSGAITGNPDAEQQFSKAEQYFKDRGYSVFNPLCLGKGKSYSEYMRRDIKELLDCDYICYVNDTQSSCGAMVERNVAMVCGISEITTQDMEGVTVHPYIPEPQ
mgnify:CR=1 FL=1